MPLHSVNAHTVKQWLDAGEAVLVDVREPAEYAAEHIAGAVPLPLASVRVAALPPHVGKKLVLQCRKGGRGGSACEKLLAEDGGRELYNLEGGLLAWTEAGYPAVTSASRCLPLDQQVQLTIGTLLLTFSVLGALISPQFFWATGIIGAGLTVAGLTGFCGLARIIARMPWNQKAQSNFCQMK